ncbi:MAG: IclR family transcriptional regulator [Microbacteriaceae bacterium]|nr:MAG: IclR family transcriptional regulator [Microbacteriaceae bacterium]
MRPSRCEAHNATVTMRRPQCGTGERNRTCRWCCPEERSSTTRVCDARMSWSTVRSTVCSWAVLPAVDCAASTAKGSAAMSQSVRRAANIIDSIAAAPKSVAQLAEEFELHRSTMFRELQTLEEVGYVRRRRDGTYALAFRLVALGQASLESLDLRQAAFATVRRLHRLVGNTVHVAALMDDSIIYVDKVEDASGLRMYSRVGSPVRPHCSAVGKAILAYSGTAERDAVLAGTDWKKYTESTITTYPALAAELDIVAEQGWAADRGEFEDFVNCVAVPIWASSHVVGGLSLTAIRMVQDLDQLLPHIPLMQRSAAAISRELG